MPAHVIIGTQWGDEGKGRIADWFASQADIVARFAGGDNAGHTVQVGENTFKLHLVPSGVIHPNARCMMGSGMVVNPVKLVSELKALNAQGIDISPARIRLAHNAHLITPAHIALDGAKEAQLGSKAIGTTKRGIGPAYTDKIARTGLRAGLMQNSDVFEAQLRQHVETANRTLTGVYQAEPVDADAVISELLPAAEFLRPYLEDVPLVLHQALENGKTVLCEGAQGTLLDIDHGNYPYVTSSSPTVGGVITGLGIGPKHIDRVIGISKAYATRVGAGPFPTELHDVLGDKLRGTGANPWDEFGTTTGRPRRCGWLDTLILRYSARINGLTELVITKLDILSGFDEIALADAYDYQGQRFTEMPTEQQEFAACTPVYDTLPGWQEDVMGTRSFDALPAEAQNYIQHIEKIVNLPINLITVGPARDQTIVR